MFAWSEGTAIAIFGTGELAKKLYYRYKHIYKIVHFFDNDTNKIQLGLMYGKPILSVNQISLCEEKILIASSYWEEISKQLNDSGLKVYDNYLPFWAFEYDSIQYNQLLKIINGQQLDYVLEKLRKDKLGVIIHGNCQTSIIKNYLKVATTFSKKYIFLDTPFVFAYDDNKNYQIKDFINEALWNNCSLLITQYIYENNRFSKVLSTKFIFENLFYKTKSIIISNLYFSGYFPQHIKNKKNYLEEIHISGCYPNGDINIEQLIEKKYSTEDIINIISSDDFYSEDFISQYIENEFDKIEYRESNCDIKIIDFIKDHYKKRLLFYSCNHPTNFLLRELAMRILKYIGINEKIEPDFKFELENFWGLKGTDEVVYPSVQKYLNLDLSKEKYYSNRWIDEEALYLFEDYIKNYILNCFEENK